tara:strand:- start:237 stop:443 length:207 start_codon:yes stop_codon:yes gene_type:complete
MEKNEWVPNDLKELRQIWEESILQAKKRTRIKDNITIYHKNAEGQILKKVALAIYQKKRGIFIPEISF